ncbi:peroxynitrite isomerase [Nocardia stercoris]|uniref:Peroxynitrite isomerase n=1 Tax=Nocardia stercoris TaxID=2483361 RepID=A0A3M2LI07_9NOCA|nr:FABP family protein [Nocardia stercoris]RMI35645.1 FABP family protein [Nocardia stercoris]
MVEPQPPVAPHPDIALLAPLLGVWRGHGHGEYPTISPFDYSEEVEFGHVGRPFLTYRQRTRHAEDGRGLHAETGYLRCPAPGRVEWILAHPTGITEIGEGTATIEDGVLTLNFDSTHIGCSGTAKPVTAVGRSLTIVGDTLEYGVRMAAVGEPLTHHLSAVLKRA